MISHRIIIKYQLLLLSSYLSGEGELSLFHNPKLELAAIEMSDLVVFQVCPAYVVPVGIVDNH